MPDFAGESVRTEGGTLLTVGTVEVFGSFNCAEL